jgi:hypothetical protein
MESAEKAELREQGHCYPSFASLVSLRDHRKSEIFWELHCKCNSTRSFSLRSRGRITALQFFRNREYNNLSSFSSNVGEYSFFRIGQQLIDTTSNFNTDFQFRTKIICIIMLIFWNRSTWELELTLRSFVQLHSQ